MKLSAFILSVNIAATLPIAMQCAAQASEDANSNSAYVPKNSIKSPDAQPKTSKITAARRKFSIAPQVPPPLALNVINVNGVNLRPFVAGRKLPHRTDLQNTLTAQQPSMAAEQSPLSARISESYNASAAQSGIAPYSQSNYAANTPYMTSAPRVMPNQTQAVARQTKQSLKRHGTSKAQSPPTLAEMQAQLDSHGDAGQYSSEPPAGYMANQQNLNIVAPPATPGLEGGAGQMAQQQPMENIGTAGPPPFPLNLLPQQSLKQFIGSRPPAARKAAQTAPRSFFGSWHGNTSVVAHNVGPTIGLPPAGFQSHLTSRGFGGPHVAVKHASHIAKQPKILIAQARKPAVGPVAKISIYPPYNTAYSPAY